MRQVFTKKASQYYDELVKSIDNQINKLPISHNTTANELTKMKNQIFEQNWKWYQMEIIDEPTDKGFEDKVLSRDEANTFLGNYTWNMSNPGILATMAYYVFNYTGDIKALDLTTNYNSRHFFMSATGKEIKFMIYGQGDRNAVATNAKHQKQLFINAITENQKNVNDFFELQSDNFKNTIEVKVDGIYNKAVKDNDDKDLL